MAPGDPAFWRYRLLSTGIIVVAVVLLLLSLFAQVLISAAQEVIAAWFPRLDDWIADADHVAADPGAGALSVALPAVLVADPGAYRKRRYPKWPGALLVTAVVGRR